MKFVSNKADILKEISVAQEIISSRNSLSILSNVLIEANDSVLTIKATDLKVSFETSIPVETTEPGTTTVFCDRFLGILRSLPDGDIEFEQQDQRLDIRPLYKKIDFQLKSIAGDKFPELQEISDDSYFELPQKDVLEMINQTVFAVSDDETRYFMNGVYMENIDGKLIMVATDGRRLSFISKPIDENIASFEGVIVPPKILSLIRKLASGEGNISLAVTDKNIFAKFDSQRLSSNLIDGQFPNYNRVIPETQDYDLIVDKSELVDALSRVSLLVEQKSRRILVTVNENSLLLHSEESEMGVAREEIPCQYQGPETSLALDYRFLAEPLRVMNEKMVTIKFTDSKKAISLLPVEEKDYVHIVAPMQLD
ncbi:MAG: DNA polymerase III subunit beta [Spirochaetales bacterium]|jgi:DNA polymerase III subunit beta|nr:DNA polymerase III subunit beta [Spirochaetales bacterium]